MTIPLQLRAGDSAAWSFDDSDHAASDGWEHSYALRGPAALDLSITGSAASFSVTVPPSVSSLWTPGRYTWARVAVRGADERATLEAGVVEILPDLVTQTAPTDTRSHARRMLEAIEATLEGRATSDSVMLSIKGRTVQKTPVPELLQLRDRYRAEANREDAAAGLRPGVNRLFTRFAR